MAPKWQYDPELFLYRSHKKDILPQIWRCKITTMSTFAPLCRKDFNDEVPIEDHLDIASSSSMWNQASYGKLLEYIKERHFLVNFQGLVFEELYKFGETEVITDSNRIYVRLHDVINMAEYGLHVPVVPYRTVLHLEGRTKALVEPSPAEIKLQDDLAVETSKVTTLREELNKEKQRVTGLVADKMKLSADVTNLHQELNKEKRKKQDLEKELADLKGKVIEQSSTRLLEPAQSKGRVNEQSTTGLLEPWMNRCANPDWVSVDEHSERDVKGRYTFMCTEPLTKIGTNFVEDNTTNVRPQYFYKGTNAHSKTSHAWVKLDELIPNKEKARFVRYVWYLMIVHDGTVGGTKYMARELK